MILNSAVDDCGDDDDDNAGDDIGIDEGENEDDNDDDVGGCDFNDDAARKEGGRYCSGKPSSLLVVNNDRYFCILSSISAIFWYI